MKGFNGNDRREFPRANVDFIVSYRIREKSDPPDLTHTKNLSQGGMMLTTNMSFEKGTLLQMKLRFPFLSKKIEIEGKVIGSKEILKNMIYETRIKFYGLEEACVKEFQKLAKKGT